MKAGDFEYSYKGLNKTKTPTKESVAEDQDQPQDVVMSEANETKEDDEIPEMESEEDDDMESGDESEDDPNKLWCICQQPHNNRFMICCDSCLDWFHGKCVGITKKMGQEMEDAGNEWTCPKCKNKVEKEVAEKQTAELKDKLKERETTKAKKSLTPKSKENSAEQKKVCFGFSEIQKEIDIRFLFDLEKKLAKSLYVIVLVICVAVVL